MAVYHLSIDLETYSSIPIKTAGAFRYVQSDDFQILLFAYSLNGLPVEVIDVASGEVVPDWLIKALHDPDCIKHAYNAPFEWCCLSKYYGMMDPSQWRCTMFHGLYCGYTAGLEATGAALGLPEDKKKLATGKALIRYFCIPCKPTKANGMRTRNLPQHDPLKWADFKEYNRQDVVTEMEIENRLSAFPVPDWVQKQWETDLRINSRGVFVDMALVKGALIVGAEVKQDLKNEAVSITRLDNPNSVSQLSEWLNAEIDSDKPIDNLRKETVSDLLGMDGNSPEVRRVLEIRQELGKTSTTKYNAIEACEGVDGRVRGLLQFYGANRTGRWAGRLVQVQNLPRTYTDPIDPARDFIKAKNKNALRLVYGSVPDTLSQLIRTAFIASPGNVLIDADFSAIEARVISWLAGEEWRLEVFRTHGKIYEASASQMFNIPIERIKKGNPEYAYRARGKVAELALGYQGSVGAMRRMDVGHNLDDLSDDEVQDIVDRWRDTNSKIRNLWYEMDSAAIHVIQNGGSVRVKCLVFAREYDSRTGKHCMTIRLPSGRKLYYVSPSVGMNKWGNPSIAYMGVEQGTKKWRPIETYGGKLTENVVQAIARDCLAIAIENLEAAGLPIVFHIHDEVVIDVAPFADDETMLSRVEQIMTLPIPWAPGLPLNADGWVGKYFKKD